MELSLGNTGRSFIIDQARSRRLSWERRLLLDKMLSRGWTQRKLSVLVSCLFWLLFFSLLSLPMAPTPTATYGEKRQVWPREHLSHLSHRTACLTAGTGSCRNIPGSLGIGVKAGLPLFPTYKCSQLGLLLPSRV